MQFLQQSEFLTAWHFLGSGDNCDLLLVGDPGAWSLAIISGNAPMVVLARQRGGPRVWRTLDTAVVWLLCNLDLPNLNNLRIHYLYGYADQTVRIESLEGQGDLL